MGLLESYISEQKAIEAKRREGVDLGAEVIPVNTGKGKSDAFFFRSAEEGPRPALFHIHGGAFVSGEAQMDHIFCKRLRDMCGMHVISLQYDLAPDNPYPGQGEQCYEMIRYFTDHSEEYGIDPARCAVSGISAGANLAIVEGMYAKERHEFTLKTQVLIYPYIDLITDTAEKQGIETQSVPGWAELMETCNDAYVTREQRRLPDVSPLYADEKVLEGLPAAVVITGEQDFVGNEGRKFAERLENAGVQVTAHMIQGVGHGFIDTGLNPDYTEMTAGPVLGDYLKPFQESQTAAAEQALQVISQGLKEYL